MRDRFSAIISGCRDGCRNVYSSVCDGHNGSRWGCAVHVFRRITIALVGVLCFSPKAVAISLDSIVNLPAMGVPVINYTPETSWEFGAAAQGYFCLPGQNKTSIIQLDGAYTLKHQWYVNTQGTIYFGGLTPWQLQYKAGYSHRPTAFYGVGNQGTTDIGMLRRGVPFDLQRGYVDIQTRIGVGNNWSVGPVFDFQHQRTALSDSLTPYPTLLEWGLGVVAQYDTRDKVFYPSRGLFFKAGVVHYEQALGSTARITMLHIDLRRFVPLPHDFTWAWQLRSQCALSAGDVPYPMLPCLGGPDGLRGINKSMFRDDILIALQTEMRIPLWSIFRATVFAGIGDVYDIHDWQWAVPKVSYGLGARMSVNKAKVNIRFDVARSNVDPRWNTIDAYSFYLTATEAF